MGGKKQVCLTCGLMEAKKGENWWLEVNHLIPGAFSTKIKITSKHLKQTLLFPTIYIKKSG